MKKTKWGGGQPANRGLSGKWPLDRCVKNIFACTWLVHRAAKQFGFKEVGDEEDWNLYWTDFSVSLERVMEMKRYQVSEQRHVYDFS